MSLDRGLPRAAPSSRLRPGAKGEEKCGKKPDEIIGTESGEHLYSLAPPTHSKAGAAARHRVTWNTCMCRSAGYMAPGSLTELCPDL